MENYPIQLLTNDLNAIKKALEETNAKEWYPEAYKDRMKKVNQLEEAINKLK